MRKGIRPSSGDFQGDFPPPFHANEGARHDFHLHRTGPSGREGAAGPVDAGGTDRRSVGHRGRRRTRLRRSAASRRRRGGRLPADRGGPRRREGARAAERTLARGRRVPDDLVWAGDDITWEGCAQFSTDPCILVAADVIVVAVPTPLRDGTPDLSIVRAAMGDVARALRPGQLVVLESTTYPGTTEEVVRPILESTGLVAGRDFALAYSPERINPGDGRALRDTPKIVAGVTPTDTELAALFYGALVDTVVRTSSPRQAEMAKLIENTFRQVNIALVNELATIAPAVGRRHLGGARGGRHQAVRLHAVLARPGCRRTLHRHRPELPVVEGRAAPRLRRRVHRTRPGREQPHARPTSSPGSSRC